MRQPVLVTVIIVIIACAACSSEVEGPPANTSDGGSSDTSSGECGAPGTDCTDDPNACCNGSACVFDVEHPDKSVCAATCLRDDQCEAGCCKTLVGGDTAVCAPASYCAAQCVGAGENCGSAACCADHVCVNDDAVAYPICAAECTAHGQCQSGCCAPLSNTPQVYVCSPPVFCE